MKMRLANSRWNNGAWQTKTVGTPRALSFDHPERELRQSLFHVSKPDSRKIQVHDTFRFSGELFRHERLPACHSFPIDVTLGLPWHVGAHSRKVITLSDLRLGAAMQGGRATRRELGIARRFWINDVGLRRCKFLQKANETERINTR